MLLVLTLVSVEIIGFLMGWYLRSLRHDMATANDPVINESWRKDHGQLIHFPIERRRKPR